MVLEREMEEEEDDEEEAMLQKQEEEEEGGNKSKDTPPPPWSRKMVVEEVARRLNNGDLRAKIEAARDVRRVVRKSSNTNSKSALRCRFAAAGVIEPLVSMLHSSCPLASREAALLALLNLAARNQRILKCIGISFLCGSMSEGVHVLLLAKQDGVKMITCKELNREVSLCLLVAASVSWLVSFVC